jgi:oxygen-independent coproporphyrinogen-3 oxidase
MKELTVKYDTPGPRYTSYPTVPHWDTPINEGQWLSHLRSAVLENPQKGSGLYVHIPFCEKLCSYCGCHKFITKNKTVADPYVESLLKEWSLYASKLEDIFPLRVSELHFGGGTPTFLPPNAFQALLEGLYKRAVLTENASVSVWFRGCMCVS